MSTKMGKPRAEASQARNLKAGDVTPWYTCLEDAKPSGRRGARVKVRYEDGGIGVREWTNGERMVALEGQVTLDGKAGAA
jgi:hypothetical protein